MRDQLKQFWDFLQEDSWSSLIVTLIIAFFVIKFIFFPFLSFVTGSSLPLVIIESCSMYHSTNLEDVLENTIYKEHGIFLEDTDDRSFRRGMNKGDVVLVLGATNLEVGDVIIFNGGATHPIIHRIISLDPLQTKGDHNKAQLPFEKNIPEATLIGKAAVRVPYIGWAKLIFFELTRSPQDRGFCD